MSRHIVASTAVECEAGVISHSSGMGLTIAGTVDERRKSCLRRFQLDLTRSELKLIIESLEELEQKWDEICQNSDDEDENADIGNDLIELRLLSKPLKEKAVEAFGKGILEFSRGLL